MTQSKDQIDKTTVLNSAFLSLNDTGQDGALAILRSLQFAQSVMERTEQPPNPPPKQTA